MGKKEYSDLLNEVYESNRMMSRVNSKLVKRIFIVGVLVVVLMVGYYYGWFS